MTMKVCGIYYIKNLVNNKIYIGQANNIYKRWKDHIWKLNNNRHHNKHLQRAWNKCGEKNFKFEIICECNINRLLDLEKYYIEKYDTFFNGYNLTVGGEGTYGHRVSKEARYKIGKAQKGKTISKENREKLSKYFKGSGNPFYGRTHTDETKKLISDIRKANGYSKGGNNCKAKKVVCNKVIYDCALDCADFYNIKSCTLRSWLRGDRPMPLKFKDMGLSYVQPPPR